MNAQTQAHRRQIFTHLRTLSQTLNTTTTPTISHARLTELGCLLSRVSHSTETVSLSFSPSFITPQPPSIFRTYPLTFAMDFYPLPLEMDEMLFDSGTEYIETDSDDTSDKEDGVDNMEIPENIHSPQQEHGRDSPRVHMNKASRIHEHVRSYIIAPRDGLEPGDDFWFASLSDLTPLSRKCDRPSRPELALSERDTAHPWRCEGIYSAPDCPHAILTVLHGVRGDDESLCVGEVKAVVRCLRSRYAMKEFRGLTTMGILVISYMGPKHGRILHGHHDGENLVLQYSTLMSFEQLSVEDPSKLFVRYTIGIPESEV